jgi:chemotaxis protein CheX
MTQELLATDEQIVGITQDVWSSFTGRPVDPAPPAEALDGGEVTVGRVEVTGAWRGWVLLACPARLARTAAAAMFERPAETLTDGEVADALGELANMVGGNLKSVLPGPSRLSMPAVTVGAAAADPVPGGALVNAVSLTCDGLPLTVSVWRAG